MNGRIKNCSHWAIWKGKWKSYLWKFQLVFASCQMLLLSDAIQTNWSVNLLEPNLHSSTPSFKLDWPFRCLVISCMFTCQSFKEAHKILLRGFGPQRGWVGTPLVRNLVFFRTGKKKHHVLSFLEIFFRCHLCGCSKKREGSSIHLCIYDIFWYFNIW